MTGTAQPCPNAAQIFRYDTSRNCYTLQPDLYRVDLGKRGCRSLGGPGSTRWRQHRPKPLVEETPCLDLLHPEWKAFMAAPTATGTIKWRRAGSGSYLAEVTFALSAVEEDGTRLLALRFPGDPCPPDHLVILEHTRVGFSRRWYARCPGRCGRRARKLFLVPAGDAFRCRSCAGLGYLTTRTSDARVHEYRRDPLAFLTRRNALTGVQSALTTLGLASKSTRRVSF